MRSASRGRVASGGEPGLADGMFPRGCGWYQPPVSGDRRKSAAAPNKTDSRAPVGESPPVTTSVAGARADAGFPDRVAPINAALITEKARAVVRRCEGIVTITVEF